MLYRRVASQAVSGNFADMLILSNASNSALAALQLPIIDTSQEPLLH